jgi:hypothetical protein
MARGIRGASRVRLAGGTQSFAPAATARDCRPCRRRSRNRRRNRFLRRKDRRSRSPVAGLGEAGRFRGQRPRLQPLPRSGRGASEIGDAAIVISNSSSRLWRGKFGRAWRVRLAGGAQSLAPGGAARKCRLRRMRGRNRRRGRQSSGHACSRVWPELRVDFRPPQAVRSCPSLQGRNRDVR